MKTLMTIYRVGEPVEVRELDLPEDPGYDCLKSLVCPLLGVADFEHVYVLLEGQHADMFVDELGQLKRLPRNDEATAIYRANWLNRHPKADPASLPAIAGTAIVFDRRVWF